MMYSKEQQTKSKRIKPKRGTKTRITESVRKEVKRRSEGKCERCGVSSAYSFEMAHLIQASQGGSGSDPTNVMLLCGPSVNTGTCHNIVDYSREGRAWAKQAHNRLKKYYEWMHDTHV